MEIVKSKAITICFEVFLYICINIWCGLSSHAQEELCSEGTCEVLPGCTSENVSAGTVPCEGQPMCLMLSLLQFFHFRLILANGWIVFFSSELARVSILRGSHC